MKLKRYQIGDKISYTLGTQNVIGFYRKNHGSWIHPEDVYSNGFPLDALTPVYERVIGPDNFFDNTPISDPGSRTWMSFADYMFESQWRAEREMELVRTGGHMHSSELKAGLYPQLNKYKKPL